MFQSFDGDFKRRPIVSIRGASKKESKEELLERAQKERHLREVHRKQQASSIKIQSWYRGHLERKRLRDELRQNFDLLRASKSNMDHKPLLAKQICFFFRPNQDYERLNWFCHLCVGEKTDILQKADVWFPYRISGLLKLALKFCSDFAQDNDNIGSPLRLIEIFTSLKDFPIGVNVSLFKTLVADHYFRHLRRLVDRRVPPMMHEMTSPPTPMAETLLSLINMPIKLIADPVGGLDHDFCDLVLTEITTSFFSSDFSEQVELFILPAMSTNKQFPFHSWIKVLESNPKMKSNPWLFYTILKFGEKQTELDSSSSELLSSSALLSYVSVLTSMSASILPYRHLQQTFLDKLPHEVMATGDDDDDDDDIGDDDTEMADLSKGQLPLTESLRSILDKSLRLLNSSAIVRLLISVSDRPEQEALQSMCRLCHNLLIFDSLALHHFRLLNTLAFRPALLRKLWNLILATKRDSLGSHSVPLLTVISRGIRMNPDERDAIIPLLAVFVALFGYLLVTIHDLEFYGDDVRNETNNSSGLSSVWMPFSLGELVPMSLALRDVTLGLIELAFPESRPVIKEEYQHVIQSVRNRQQICDTEDTLMWSHLFKITVQLVRQLHARDMRRQFCPDEHWISGRVSLPVERAQNLSLRRSGMRWYRPFHGLRILTREELVSEGPPLSAKEVRLTTVLRELPFTISFSHRVQVFHNMVARDRYEHQGESANFLQGKQIYLHIRRNFIYEDAFDKLSPDNEPDLRLKMRLTLTNAAGLDEAGIDGGGLFREFLTELLKTSFDPNRGFFRLTNDQQLYPNPKVDQVVENFVPHYFFIGRMLGKALYENMLVELPLASFFLSKMLGQHTINVDIDHLQSLDPELYKNLLYLKTYQGDVQDLGLDFTIASTEFGRTSVEDLKPGGSEIPVTNENKIEYIHLVADYKLNRQIRKQCNAFRQGLSDVINLDWLRMFSHRDLQTLISGADTEINIDDLMKNTNYGHGFTATHETILIFWDVVRSLTQPQKRQLLKFVTSCSRPPLLGFKELNPPFCIQNAGSEPDRLPTSSTCMNLLKLPEFKDKDNLKTKLLYAIEAGAGFELS